MNNDPKYIARLNAGTLPLSDAQVLREFAPLVRAVARRQQGRRPSLTHLVREGEKGLLKAWHSYVPSRDILFIPWATHHIRAAIDGAQDN